MMMISRREFLQIFGFLRELISACMYMYGETRSVCRSNESWPSNSLARWNHHPSLARPGHHDWWQLGFSTHAIIYIFCIKHWPTVTGHQMWFHSVVAVSLHCLVNSWDDW
jgi:hypothetical protein